MPIEKFEDHSILPLANDHNVYILGAGFSAEGGLPVVSNFLNRLRDSHPWLIEQGRKAEAAAVQAVLDFRQKATSASYWTRIDLENIEELFSLASIRGEMGNGQLLSSIRLAIAATLDFAWKKSCRQEIDIIHQPDHKGNFKKVPIWFKRSQGSPDGVYRAPLFAYFAARLLGILGESGTIVGENTFLTFNYDTLLEDSFSTMAVPFNYGFRPEAVEFHKTARVSAEDSAIKILKLHGSVNLGFSESVKPVVFASYGDVLENNMGPDLVPPTWNKRLTSHLEDVWSCAVNKLKTATRIIVLGFSMPTTDIQFKYLLGAGLKENISLREIVFINSDSEALKKRVLDVFRSEHIDKHKIRFEDLAFSTFLAHGRTHLIGRPIIIDPPWRAQ